MADRYDIAIVGTGPAGISAAITAKARNKNVLLLGSADISDKVSKAHVIRNYPGLPDIPGDELAKRFRKHLDAMGIQITDRRVTMIYSMGDYYSLQIDQDFIEASAVILATGVSFGKSLPGEDENLGRGVSYCATCDGALYRGKEAVIAGYAPKEEADARFLAEMARKVTYIPVYKKDVMPGNPADMFPGYDNIEVLIAKPVSIEKIAGVPRNADADHAGSQADEKNAGRMLLRTDNGDIISDGIFLLRESVAPDKLVPGLELDGNHIKTDRNMASNLPGLFAAGDIAGTPYQYIKSAGEGNVAALSAVSYIDGLKGGIR